MTVSLPAGETPVLRMRASRAADRRLSGVFIVIPNARNLPQHRARAAVDSQQKSAAARALMRR